MIFGPKRRLALWNAAKAGDLESVQELLSRSPRPWRSPVNLNWRNPAQAQESSAIYVACQGGFADVVTCLSDNGAEFNFPGSHHALLSESADQYRAPLNCLVEMYPKLQGDAAAKLAVYLLELYYTTLKDYPEAAKWDHCLARNHPRHYVESMSKARVQRNPDFAYALSQLFGGKKSLDCLYVAAINNHAAACEALKLSADRAEPYAQYLYGKWLLSRAKKIKEGLSYLFKSLHQSCHEAKDYLAETPFPGEILIEIGTCYENGLEGLLVNQDAAIQYYLRAEKRGEPAASFHLGQLYEVDRVETPGRKRPACRYYLEALKSGFLGALNPLTRLLKDESYPDLAYELGQFYENVNDDQPTSLTWYKLSSDAGYLLASARLTELVSNDAALAYHLGRYCELDLLSRDDEAALNYYALAALQGHGEAKNILLTRARSGDSQAQYVLGYHYYRKKEQLKEAILCCMKAAEQQHALSIQYLNDGDFSSGLLYFMAQHYEQEKVVPKNRLRAIQFYSKAARRNHTESVLRLAELYEVNSSSIQPDPFQSLAYYIQLMGLGHEQASMMMSRLAEEGNRSMRQQVRQDCQSRDDPKLSQFWREKGRSRSIRPDNRAAERSTNHVNF